MDAAELKMILDAISTVSGDASRAAVWWMALHYGTKIIGFAVAGVVIVLLARTVAGAVCGTSEWARLGVEVSRAWGAFCPSTFNPDHSDRAAIAKAVTAGRKERGK